MDKRILVVFPLVIIIAACTPYKPYVPTGEVIVPLGEIAAGNATGEVLQEVKVEEVKPKEKAEEAKPEEKAEESKPEEKAEAKPLQGKELIQGLKADISAYEGDLIDLKPFVKDPDGDQVKLGYTAPFDQNGIWQTKVGDEGFYSVIVTATDNKESFVTKQIILRILVKNKPPVIKIADRLEFAEGDLIRLNPEISDVDGDEVVVIYSGWMDSKAYQTTYEDAGIYAVNIRADDGREIVSKNVTVVVRPFNRKPEIKMLSSPRLQAVEGDLVEIKAVASDPDGDSVSFKFTAPFDEKGRWQTKAGDAGTQKIRVTAGDGTDEVVNEVLVEVAKKNAPPAIKSITVTPNEVVLKKPGDTVKIEIKVDAADPDGDALKYTFAGFMDATEKTVRYGEKGGQKKVTVTVSDGKDSVSQDISFDMNNWPCFECT